MKLPCVLLLFLLALAGWGQEMKSLEFRDQNIRDILITLGELNGASIVPDETVTGRASYVFANMDFRKALQVFLDTYRLSAVMRDDVYYVSRVAVRSNPDGTVDVAAQDVPVKDVLRVLSNQTASTILADNLPNDPITINVRSASVEDVLKIAIARYPDFALDVRDKFFYLKNRTQGQGVNAIAAATDQIRQSSGKFTLQISRGRFKDLLLTLFQTGKRQFVLLLDRDITVENLFLSDLDFDAALRSLLLPANADFKIEDNVYYIFDVQRNDILKQYVTSVVIPFQYISSADFVKLLPPELNSGNYYRIDDKGNKLVLSGSFEEIEPLADFVKLVDQPSRGNLPIRVDLKYVKTDDVLPLMPPEFAGFNPQPLPGKSAIVVSLPESRRQAFLDFIAMVDQPMATMAVRLRFLKADDLLAKLPPSATEANIVRTNDPSLVFFRGSPESLARFRKDLELLDVPRPLLRYELLVMQFEEGEALNLSPNLTVQMGDTGQAFAATLGQLLNFNFDIVGSFGLGFGVNLNAAIANSGAKVVADTTLHGLSGEKVSFQNTMSTYYVANEISTTGNATVVGTVNQLASGLFLNLQGWISSDDMVTLQMDATLSKQDSTGLSPGSAQGNSANLPPNTTEKKLSTQVRMSSGSPLVIGGLKEDDTSRSFSKTPFLGDIPLLGFLFRSEATKVKKTEFTIYIVPVLERPDERSLSGEERMLLYYRRLGSGR